jgi:signal transduction histidine kinase
LVTKWKNKSIFIIWLLLITYGVNNFIIGIPFATTYTQKDYFTTDMFYADLERFANELQEYARFSSKEEAIKNITVSDAEVQEHQYKYGELNEKVTSIRKQYEHKIAEAKKAGLNDLVATLEKEQNAKLDDIKKNFSSDDHIRSKIKTEKEQEAIREYESLQNRQEDFNNRYFYITYFLEDPKTGKIYTNNTHYIQSIGSFNNYFDESEILFSQSFPTKDSHRYARTLSPLEGKILITESSALDYPELQMYKEKQKLYFIQMISGLLALIISFFLYRYAKRFAGEIMEKHHSTLRKIPLDVSIGILLFSIVLMLDGLDPLSDLSSLSRPATIKYFTITFIISGLFMFIATLQLLILKNHFRYQDEQMPAWKKSIIYKLIQAIRHTFLQQKVGLQLFFLLGVVYAGGFGICVVLFHPNTIVVYLALFIFIFLPIVYIFFKHIGYYNRIKNATDELIKGNYSHKIPVEGKTTLAQLAKNINILKEGMASSQKEQVKSERLKTELISNVSHDLRTPLTSIITYTDLLKKEGLTKEEQHDYIQIIDQKSQRLKVLIEDLFEVSKMSSGSIDLQKENGDVVQLLQQALAEYDEKIKTSTLQFRFTKQADHIYAFIDGQKMWRVFDNLINNILKYSLENTRVYLSVIEKEDHVIISFKNVSKFELGDDIEELFQRFKRGDESRHTEGSGLGLAIAKSIVDLHDGDLQIDVDGDLFKITITLYKNKD